MRFFFGKQTSKHCILRHVVNWGNPDVLFWKFHSTVLTGLVLILQAKSCQEDCSSLSKVQRILIVTNFAPEDVRSSVSYCQCTRGGIPPITLPTRECGD